jgi:hypothetical protein
MVDIETLGPLTRGMADEPRMSKEVGVKKIGRPLKSPPRNAAKRIEKLAREGYTKLSIARILNTSKGTLHRWMSESPELQEAFDSGREVIHHELTSILLKKARAEQTVPLLFALKGMFGWREGEQAEQGNRVAITFNLPDAMPMKDFVAIHEQSATGTQSLSIERPLVTQRG